jgi:hypothetical protein
MAAPRRKAMNIVTHRLAKSTTPTPRVLKRIVWASFLLAGLLAAGTLGFLRFGGPDTDAFDAFYMTAITITTVGYSEVVDLSQTDAGRLFAAFVSFAGFGLVTFIFSSLTVFFLETDLNEALRRRRMENAIRKLRNHYIVCGFGRVGHPHPHESSDPSDSGSRCHTSTRSKCVNGTRMRNARVRGSCIGNFLREQLASRTSSPAFLQREPSGRLAQLVDSHLPRAVLGLAAREVRGELQDPGTLVERCSPVVGGHSGSISLSARSIIASISSFLRSTQAFHTASRHSL